MAQFLTTKLHVPPTRPRLVSRPRLLARLDAGLYQKLTLVSTPAGFGKTTLVSTWADHCERPFAWLSLDEGDNDVARFWSYLVAALQSLPGFPQEMDDIGAPDEADLTTLLNQIDGLSIPAVLVLDDYHLITSSIIHERMAFFLTHLPPSLHLVIAGRADPPLPIALLRARGELTELRQGDLRFTPEEAAAFMRETMDLALTTEDVTALTGRTEGWIAGLQMAAVSMQRRDDLGAFVRDFAGSHRYVMDYLMEEVLQRESAEVQAFLLHTSILDRFCAPLCDAVFFQRPQAGSQAILEGLEQRNLFILPLDDRRSWYRYHRLFADLLQRQVSQRHPDLVPDLHRRASGWFEDQGLLPESIEHALAAGEFEHAAALVRRETASLLQRGELMTLRRWLDLLPAATLRRQPELSAHHAWLLLLDGEPLQAIESRFAAMEDADRESGEIQAVRAFITLLQGKMELGAELVTAALVALTEEDGFWYDVAEWLDQALHAQQGVDPDREREGETPLERSIRSQLRRQNVPLAVLSLCNLGELRMKQGRLREAEKLFNRALAQATDAQGELMSVAGEPLIWLGELARERNDLAEAERYLTQGIDLSHEWGRLVAIDGYIALTRLRQAQGRIDAAYAALEHAERLAAMFDATDMDDLMVALCGARIAALEGDFDAVQAWIASRGLDALDPDDLQIDATIPLHLRKYELATLGLSRIREGQPAEALRFLVPLLSEVAARGRWGLGIEVLAQQAAAYDMLEETDRALGCLDEALTRAEPEGYVRVFVEIGRPMAQLLYKAAQRDTGTGYAGRLLAAFPEPPSGTPVRADLSQTGTQPESLIEPLSARELEVLRAIAEGLSNQKIAQRLFISERTVKWHAGNIYGKLLVSNRTEAVAKAQALGILIR